MKLSNSQTFRWPYQVRQATEVPDNFKVIVKEAVQDRRPEIGFFIPPVEDAWVTRRARESYVLMLFDSPAQLFVFTEDRYSQVNVVSFTPQQIRMFTQATGLLLGQIEFVLAVPGTFISICYKHSVEPYLKPLVVRLLCLWLEVACGGAEGPHFPGNLPYRYQTGLGYFFPADSPILSTIYHPEGEVRLGFLRRRKILDSFWVLTQSALIVIRQADHQHWGYTTLFVSTKNLLPFHTQSDLKTNLGVVGIRVKDTDEIVKVPVQIGYMERFLSMSEKIRENFGSHSEE
jgi:hypothetical protein